MKITIESTSTLIPLDAINHNKCRIWRGNAANGLPFVAYVVLIQVPPGGDASEFEAELDHLGSDHMNDDQAAARAWAVAHPG